jgi:hypothetical protein
MKVILTTNIDAYKTNCFPANLPIPPRVGELVRVVDVFVKHFQDQKLPITLEVTRVTWGENYVVCDLWYNKTQKELADAAGAKTL